MSFDIPLHIENNTPEGQLIQAIIVRDHVSPEEAVLRALRSVAPGQSSDRVNNEPIRKPGELLFGLYADEPELMQRISEDSRRARDSEVVRTHGA